MGSHFPEVIPESFSAVVASVWSMEGQDKPKPLEPFNLRVMDVAGLAFGTTHDLKGSKAGSLQATALNRRLQY
jgi:hypothetical protein